MPAPDSILQLVDNFETHRRAYPAQDYNETQVRREFIDPFNEALGWDKARRVNMTCHDLMIEAMEAMGIRLHREDIFQWVDYRRTATRNTMFEFLSLSECPYIELRYRTALFCPQRQKAVSPLIDKVKGVRYEND